MNRFAKRRRLLDKQWAEEVEVPNRAHLTYTQYDIHILTTLKILTNLGVPADFVQMVRMVMARCGEHVCVGNVDVLDMLHSIRYGNCCNCLCVAYNMACVAYSMIKNRKRPRQRWVFLECLLPPPENL